MIDIFPVLKSAFSFPAGIDVDLAVDTICIDTAELELLYSKPETLEGLIKRWCKRRAYIWEELEKTLHYDYNPIHNYDRTEERTHTETRNLKNTEERVAIEKENIGNNVTNTQNTTGESSQSDGKAAYNSGNIVTTATADNNATQNTTIHGNSEEIRAKDNTDDTTRTDTGTVTNIEKITAKGNIGVMSTQEMIKKQREIVEFDIYHYIAEDFKTEFCIMVY